jgi:hypothetical protein
MVTALPQASSRPRRLPLAGLLLAMLSLTPLLAGPSFAEVRIVTGEGEYRMGDRDTRLDAEHLALEAAKRNALEQVATYLESVTVVRDLDIATDEIRAYTAGLLIVLEQRSTARIENNAVVIHMDLVAQVDSDEVVAAITALRENEEARRQLAALRTEMDQLHQELDQANAQLAAATDPQQIQALSQQRQDLLNQARSNDLLAQAWTDWSVGGTNAALPPLVGYGPAQALLVQAWQLAPWNRHVQVAQQRIMPQVVLPQYARPTPVQAQLQPTARPRSGIIPGPWYYQSPARVPAGARPTYGVRPVPPHMRMYVPQGSGSNGRGRRR